MPPTSGGCNQNGGRVSASSWERAGGLPGLDCSSACRCEPFCLSRKVTTPPGTTTISVVYREMPSFSHLRVRSLPRTRTRRPLSMCSASIWTSPGWKVTTLCHSARSVPFACLLVSPAFVCGDGETGDLGAGLCGVNDGFCSDMSDQGCFIESTHSEKSFR